MELKSPFGSVITKSWFDENCGDKALKAVKSLKSNIPTRNFYTEGKSGFSKSLSKAFNASASAGLFAIATSKIP